jgi:hypothetical protein
MFPRIYPTVLEAVEVGERVMAALERVPHRRPFRVDVVDVWTRETVTSVRLGVERDPDVCVACGAPSDPFGPVEQDQVPPPPAGGAHPTPLPVGGTPGPAASDNTWSSAEACVDPGPPAGLDE